MKTNSGNKICYFFGWVSVFIAFCFMALPLFCGEDPRLSQHRFAAGHGFLAFLIVAALLFLMGLPENNDNDRLLPP